MTMSKERLQAIAILDLVENYIEENKEELLNRDPEAAHINGEEYYTLEDDITKLLEDN